MSREDEAVAILRQSGHKLTPQRLMVVSALRQAEGHMSASQILEQVQRAYPYVDISTVYRTMAMLKELRLVTETDMGGGELSYEWSTGRPHHHLICQRCGAVQELNHSALDTLAQQLLADYGFQASIDHFAIFGSCRTCSATATTAAPVEAG
ncbi:MAG: Fur family transcriptional regulator [Dehalococcoidia bacterium]